MQVGATTKADKQKDFYNKILSGPDRIYDKLIEFKKQKSSELVVLKDGKIVRIKPELAQHPQRQ